MNTIARCRSFVKGFLIFFVLVISISNVYALDNLKKEKKALIEFIKSEYDSWTRTYPQLSALDSHQVVNEPIVTNSDLQMSENKVIKRSAKFVSFNQKVPVEPNQFRDFEFTIVNHQAIVQFIVNDQLVSAFFEKENGNWKLVCAAHLDQPI